jgi:hypothetical protein
MNGTRQFLKARIKEPYFRGSFGTLAEDDITLRISGTVTPPYHALANFFCPCGTLAEDLSPGEGKELKG